MFGICMPKKYSQDEDIKKFILANKSINGILIRNEYDYNFYLQNKEKLYNSKPDGIRDGWKGQCHIDEPSHKSSWFHDKLDLLVSLHPDLSIGDLNKSSLKSYAKKYPYSVKLTYTAFRKMWFNFYDFGIDLRIPAWFGLFRTNQISFWKWMEKEFGERFSVCWINVDMNKGDYEILSAWAKQHKKEIWFYYEDKLNKEKIIEELSIMK